ncbi:MAG: aspartyl/glutamyl-tRNA amidotransferase subunit C [Nitrosopumilus sp.]
MNHLVTEEEIERVAKLMKIDVHDHKEYVEKVHEMIDYFDILDSAGVSDEEIKMKSLPLSSFREDKHIPFEEKLIDNLKNYKGTYVRAPKMV